MFNSEGMHVLDVQAGLRKLMITVETDAEATGCRSCAVVATGLGRPAGHRGRCTVLRRAGVAGLVQASVALR